MLLRDFCQPPEFFFPLVKGTAPRRGGEGLKPAYSKEAEGLCLDAPVSRGIK